MSSRVLSGVVLLALIFGTIWLLPPLATLIVASVVAGLAAVELGAMAGNEGAPVSSALLAASAASFCVAVSMTVPQLGGVEAAPVIVMLALLVAVGTILLASGPPSQSTMARAGVHFMAPLYIGPPLGVLSAVQYVYGPRAVTVLFAVVVCSDSAQYYTGRLLGRHKLAPVVSPAKTVEGALGGLVAAALVGATLGARWIPALPPAKGLVFGVAVAAFGIIGDLFESLLKRGAGVKDSAALIPGHGGVLDRIDSWLFAAPAYYVLLRYFA
jgi:phosphatidate cytidylyltransferase